MSEYKLKNNGFDFTINSQNNNSRLEELQKEVNEKNKTLKGVYKLKVGLCVDCGTPIIVNAWTLDKDIRCPGCKDIHKKETAKKNDNARLQKIKEQRKKDHPEPYICEFCGNEFTEDWRTDPNSVRKIEPRFCCEACARAYSARVLKNNPKTKILICPECGEEFEADNRAANGIVYCPSCRKKMTKMRDLFYRYRDQYGFTGTKEEFKTFYFTFLDSKNDNSNNYELLESLNDNGLIDKSKVDFEELQKQKEYRRSLRERNKTFSLSQSEESSEFCFSSKDVNHNHITYIKKADLSNWTFLNENKHYLDKNNKEYFVRPLEREIYYYQFPLDTPIGKFERGLCFRRKEGVLTNINFDFYKPVEEEWNKQYNILHDLIYVESLTKVEIAHIFDLPFTSSVAYLYELFDMNINYLDNSSYHYNMGLYTSWEGNEYVYRSSYELIFMKYLDMRKIHYLANGRSNKNVITYINPETHKERKGYPDFYLLEYNLYIETKGEHLYDEKDLLARYDVMKQEGKDLLVIGYDNKKQQFYYYLSLFSDLNKQKYIHEFLEIKNFFKPAEDTYKKMIYN